MWKAVKPHCYKNFERAKTTLLTATATTFSVNNMTGTLLAVIFAPAAALIASWWVTKRKDAPQTPERPRADYVTREQLELALEKHSKDLEWEWTEMYDKFQKLHLRLTKRDKRSQEQLQMGHEGVDEPRTSVLNFRRLGSP